jgi:dienelactone hydrolase
MRRLTVRIILVALLLVVAAAAAWGPACARGASLVIRAAHIQGLLLSAAKADAQPFTVDPPRTIPTRHGELRARLYRPDEYIRRAVLLVPGVHAMGIDEPRLTDLARELAATGLAVLTMELPDLMKYQFTPASVDEIEDALAWLSARRELTADGRIGVMGISFAGGLSLVAAARPAVASKMVFALSFGGHGDLARTLRFLCTGIEPRHPDDPPDAPPHHRAPHDYGVAVILIGVADQLVPPEQVAPLRQGVVTYLTASQLDPIDKARAAPVFEEARRQAAALPEPAATLMKDVNTRNVAALGAKLLPVLERMRFSPSLSPEESAEPSAPVYLLHGADDSVIPSVETLLLAHHYQETHTPVKYLLSSLITHAEVNKAAAAGEVLKLVNFWADLLQE